MSLEIDMLIKRKILTLLHERQGVLNDETWKQIDAGTLDLASCMDHLVRDKYIRYEASQRCYILTNRGRERLIIELKGDRVEGC